MKITAPAKLNLTLHILGKRPDGYHNLKTQITFTEELFDELTFEKSDTFKLTIKGEFANHVPPKNDLISRAVHLLAQEANTQPNVHIHLTKNIPAGAGLGGGSADAAATLRGLNQFWNLNLPQEKLMHLAAELGSDIPACILSQPLTATGRGEIITPTPYTGNPYALIIWPKTHLSTADVFKNFNLNQPSKEERLSSRTRFGIPLQKTQPLNHLQPTACQTYQEVAEIITSHKAQLNGSGSSCFLLFETQEQAERTAKNIETRHKDYWLKISRILTS